MRSVRKHRRRMTTTLAVGTAAALCSAGTMVAATESPPAGEERQAGVAQSADFAVEYPSDGEVLDDPRPTFRGTATGDASISLDVDGERYAQTQAVDGSWTLTPERDLPVGVPFSITVTEARFVDTLSHIVVTDLAVRYPQVTVDAPADGATTAGDVVVEGSSFANAMIGVRIEGEALDEPLVAGMSSDVPGEADQQWPGTFDINTGGDWTFSPEGSLPAGGYELTADASQIGADPELAESEVTSSFVVSDDGEIAGNENPNAGRVHRDVDRQPESVSAMFAAAEDERQPPITPISASVPVEGQEFLDPRPRLAGSGQRLAHIDVVIDGDLYGETVSDPDSAYWTLTPEQDLPVGVRFDAVFTQEWEFAGDVYTDSETVSDLGVRMPRVAVISPEHGSAVAGDVVFYGTSFPGATVEVRLDGENVDGDEEWPGELDIGDDGQWTFVPDAELLDGEYTVIADATLDGGDAELSDSTSGTWFTVSGDGQPSN